MGVGGGWEGGGGGGGEAARLSILYEGLNGEKHAIGVLIR